MKKKTLRNLAIALPLTVVAIVGVAHAVQDYQGGSVFQPFASDRALQSNQVLFPDDGETTGKQPSDEQDNSALWEKNQDAEDLSSPQQKDRADYLFQNNTPDGGLSGALSGDSTTSAGVSSDQVNMPGSIFDVVGDRNNADLIISGGTLPSGTGTGGGTTTPGTPGNDATNNGGGTTPGGNGNQGGTVTPTPTPPPTPTPTPTPTPAPTPGKDNTGGGTVTPEPTPTTPTQPVPGYGDASKDDPDIEPEYPSTNGKFNSSNITDFSLVRPNFAAPWDPNWSGTIALYRGQKNVTKETIFRSLDLTFTDYNTSDWKSYDLTLDDMGEDGLIQITGISIDGGGMITEFPVSIPNDAVTVDIFLQYRLTKDTDSEWGQWQEYSRLDYDTFDMIKGVRYTLARSRMLVLKDFLKEEGTVIGAEDILNRYDQYPDDYYGDYLNLFKIQADFLGTKGTRLTSLFPGWMENAALVPFHYPITTGRHVLEPAPKVALSSAYTVEMQPLYLNDNYELDDSVLKQSFLQTLTYYKKDPTYDSSDGTYHYDTIQVPQYVQAVHFLYDGVSTDYMELPDSVVYIDTTGVPNFTDDWLAYDHGLKVKKGYIVAEDNPRYTAKEGILYNKEETEMLGVPSSYEKLTVGENITKVVLPYQCELQELVLNGDSMEDLPEINYEHLTKHCKIVVPDALVQDFLEAEKDVLNKYHLTVTGSSEANENYVVKDDYILTESGMLHKVLRTDVRWLSLPDYVHGIEKGALDGLDDMTVLILPQSSQALTLESGCFDGAENLSTVACYHQAQVEAANQAVTQPAGLLSLFHASDFKVKLIDVIDPTGYSYLKTVGGVLLLTAPQDITEFNGTFTDRNDETVTATAISDEAFQEHDNLRWVELPEGTKGVGQRAFASCGALEGVLFHTTDTILIGKDAFAQCPNLRFVASNAQNCVLQDPDFTLVPEGKTPSEDYSLLLCPDENAGYNGNWTSFGGIGSYDVVDCGGTKVLCGADENGDWLTIRSGRQITGKVDLPKETVEIYKYAFEGARAIDDGSFDLNWTGLPDLQYIDGRAFASSDLGGEIVLPQVFKMGDKVFADCRKLTSASIGVGGYGFDMLDEVFYDCTNLTSVTFGPFKHGGGVYPLTFSGCSSLTDLTFTSDTEYTIPYLVYYAESDVFYFNPADWPSEKEELEHLTIHVPEGTEELYQKAWVYPIVGYSSYQDMWKAIADDLYVRLGINDIESVKANTDALLMEAENRTRALLGMDLIETLDRPYQYVIDDEGYMTLTSVKDIEYAALTAEEMDLPAGWFVDYIAKDAFAASPNLQSLSAENLAGIHDKAFQGVDVSDKRTIWMYLSGANSPDLILDEEGTPFDFGIPDENIMVVNWGGGWDENDFIQNWTLPMAGYSSLESLEAAVREELGEDADDEAVSARMTEILMAGENRVRSIVNGYDTITDPDDMLFGKGSDETETPDAGDSGDTENSDGDTDLPEWPDDLPLFPEYPPTPLPDDSDNTDSSGDTGDNSGSDDAQTPGGESKDNSGDNSGDHSSSDSDENTSGGEETGGESGSDSGSTSGSESGDTPASSGGESSDSSSAESSGTTEGTEA